MASVDSRVGRQNMWCLMEPKYRSTIQSPEKVGTLIGCFVNQFLVVIAVEFLRNESVQHVSDNVVLFAD